jgi:hypothetical protein
MYDDYGAGVDNKQVNGWAVKSVGDMISVMLNLKNNPIKLQMHLPKPLNYSLLIGK